MVHQSPRSSAEYEELMRAWGQHFTCIVPDTPGFGLSDPLRKDDPDIDDFADALAQFMAALGVARTAAYGFHSGGIILVTAMKRHPQLFSCLAVGGFAVWSAQEMELFGESYLPEFHAMQYGEHLTWLWNRILEQTWFFPWFDVRDSARLSVAHDNPAAVHAVVLDMLDSGNAYRAGYGAVLRAPRDIPAADSIVPPCLITTSDGDPLQPHIDRLSDMPAGWEAHRVATPQQHQDESLAFLRKHATDSAAQFAQDNDAGFVRIETELFSGLVHWRGPPDADAMRIPAPGSEAELVEDAQAIVIDLPGQGLSDDWQGTAPEQWPEWQAVIGAAAGILNCTQIRLPEIPVGDPDRLYPDLTPDRFGSYLLRAWQIVRAAKFFAPWYAADADHAIEFDEAGITPEKLATEHRARIRATSAKPFHLALSTKGE